MSFSDFKKININKVLLLSLNENIKFKKYYYYINFKVKRYLNDYKISFISFIKFDYLIIISDFVK